MPATVHSATASFAASPTVQNIPMHQRMPVKQSLPVKQNMPVKQNVPAKQESSRFLWWSILIALTAIILGSYFQPSFGNWLADIPEHISGFRFSPATCWSSHQGASTALANDTVVPQRMSEPPQETWNPAFDRVDDDVKEPQESDVTGAVAEENEETGTSSIKIRREEFMAPSLLRYRTRPPRDIRRRGEFRARRLMDSHRGTPETPSNCSGQFFEATSFPCVASVCCQPSLDWRE